MNCVHKKSRPFKCEFCEKVFFKKSMHKTHEMSVHKKLTDLVSKLNKEIFSWFLHNSEFKIFGLHKSQKLFFLAYTEQ